MCCIAFAVFVLFFQGCCSSVRVQVGIAGAGVLCGAMHRQAGETELCTVSIVDQPMWADY
jgi:hypothetical protein